MDPLHRRYETVPTAWETISGAIASDIITPYANNSTNVVSTSQYQTATSVGPSIKSTQYTYAPSDVTTVTKTPVVVTRVSRNSLSKPCHTDTDTTTDTDTDTDHDSDAHVVSRRIITQTPLVTTSKKIKRKAPVVRAVRTRRESLTTLVPTENVVPTPTISQPLVTINNNNNIGTRSHHKKHSTSNNICNPASCTTNNDMNNNLSMENECSYVINSNNGRAWYWSFWGIFMFVCFVLSLYLLYTHYGGDMLKYITSNPVKAGIDVLDLLPAPLEACYPSRNLQSNFMRSSQNTFTPTKTDVGMNCFFTKTRTLTGVTQLYNNASRQRIGPSGTFAIPDPVLEMVNNVNNHVSGIMTRVIPLELMNVDPGLKQIYKLPAPTDGCPDDIQCFKGMQENCCRTMIGLAPLAVVKTNDPTEDVCSGPTSPCYSCMDGLKIIPVGTVSTYDNQINGDNNNNNDITYAAYLCAGTPDILAEDKTASLISASQKKLLNAGYPSTIGFDWDALYRIWNQMAISTSSGADNFISNVPTKEDISNFVNSVSVSPPVVAGGISASNNQLQSLWADRRRRMANIPLVATTTTPTLTNTYNGIPTTLVSNTIPTTTTIPVVAQPQQVVIPAHVQSPNYVDPISTPSSSIYYTQQGQPVQVIH